MESVADFRFLAGGQAPNEAERLSAAFQRIWHESAGDHDFFVGTARVLVHNADGPCTDIVLLATRAADLDRGGLLTKAGRALAKHGARPGSAFISTLGMSAPEINQAARDVVEDILTHPQSILVRSVRVRYGGEVLDVVAPDGRGLRYGADGHFIGLLEPAP